MEYFYGGGGNNRPVFLYRFKVENCTSSMYDWAKSYPDNGPFSRFHVEWASVYNREYDVIQFEWSEAARVFRVAFAGEYTDITMMGYKLD